MSDTSSLYQACKQAILDELETQELDVNTSDLDGIIQNVVNDIEEELSQVAFNRVREYEQTVK